MFGRRSDKVKKEQVRGLGRAVLALVLSTSLVMNPITPATMALAETAGEAAASQTAEADETTTSATEETSAEEATKGESAPTSDDVTSTDANASKDEPDSADEDSASAGLTLAAAPLAAPILRAPAANAVTVAINRNTNSNNYARNETTLRNAIANNENVVLVVNDVVPLSQPVVIPAGHTVTIISDTSRSNPNGAIYRLTTDSLKGQSLFTVEEGATLTIGGANSGEIAIKGSGCTKISGIGSAERNVTGTAAAYVEGTDVTSNTGLAITNKGGTLTIADNAVVSGFITKAGSAIANVAPILTTAGTTTMTGGTITGNTVGITGNMYGVTGGLAWTGGTGTITGGTITDNHTNNNGGGVFTAGAQMTVSGGTISNNSARRGGGVLGSGNITITGEATISGNRADDMGGGAYLDGGTISGGTITGNTASTQGGGVCVGGNTVSITDGTITGNKAGAMGGGAYISSGTLNLSGGTITGNSATSEGGGVCVDGTFTMTGGTVSSNSAVAGGGVRGRTGVTTITGGTISGNTATGNGGGVVLGSPYDSLGGTATVSGNKANGNGGGVYLDNGTKITGGTISGNEAGANGNTGNGGGVAVGSGTSTISGATIKNNMASAAAGGIYVGSSANVTLTNTKVTNDLGSDGKAPTYTGGSKLTTKNGYAITNDGGTLTIADGTEVSNFNVPASLAKTIGSGDDEYCATVYTKGSGTTKMTGGTIKGNRIGYPIPEKGLVTGTPTENLSTASLTDEMGGSTTGLTDKEDRLIYTAGGLGYGDSSKGTISGGVIGDSMATLASRKNYTDVSQSGHIEGNDDANYGDFGGLMATGSANVTIKSGALIAGNEGGVGAGGVGVAGGATITMEGGTIEHNTTFFDGGGVSAFEKDGQGGTFTMTGGTINENVTYGKGGGILVHSDNVKLVAGTISNNIARVMGGGIYVCGDSNTSYNVLSIVKGNVTNNKATFAGSDLTTNAASSYANGSVTTLGAILSPDRAGNSRSTYVDYVTKALADRNVGRGLTDVETFGLSYDTTTTSKKNEGQKSLLSSNDIRLSNVSSTSGMGYLENDLIDTDKYFHTGSGGGLWLCPYGSVWNSGPSDDGNYVSITGNTAEWQGDDISKDATAPGDSGGTVLRMAGSYTYDYNAAYTYKRTGAFDSDGATSSLANDHLALKNNDTSQVQGGVQITGNVSRRGGGIGSNGVVALGPAENSTSNIFKPSITVTKSWDQGLYDQVKARGLTDDDTITITAWAYAKDFTDANGKALTRWRAETGADGKTTDVTRVKVGEATLKVSEVSADLKQTATINLDSYVTDETGAKHYLFDFDAKTGVVPDDSRLRISLEETVSSSLQDKAQGTFDFKVASVNGPLDNKPEVTRTSTITANGQTYSFSVRYNTVAFTGQVSNSGLVATPTTLPQTGQGGVAAWWLVGGLAVLAGLAASLRRGRRSQAALAAGLVALGLAVGLALAPAPAQAATTGTVTLSDQSASTATLEGRQLMAGTVVTGGDDARLQDAAWASPQAQAAVVSVIEAQEPGWTGSALDAATWLGSHMSAQVAVGLAQACAGLPVQGRVALGSTSSLEDGLWLFTTAEGEDARMATAPIVTLVGGRDLRLVAKADVPSLEKEVATVAPAGTVGAYSHANVAGLADGLSYKVTVTLPATYDAFTTYALAIEDRMEPGITLDRDSFVLADAAGRALPSSAYAVSFGTDATDGGTTFTLRVSDLKASVAKLSDSATVTLTYRAQLNGDASAGAAHPNTNEASLTYPKGPASSGTGTTQPSQTRTFAFNLALAKVDGTTGQSLSGATFSLRNVETGLWWDGSAWGSEEASFSIDGSREVPLVSPGTLELTELAAPEGYATLAEPVTLKVEADATEPVTFNLTTSTSSQVATVVESDAQVGHATVQVANSKTPTPPTPGELIRRLLPKTGDPTSVLWALVAAAAGIALVVYGRKRGGQGEE